MESGSVQPSGVCYLVVDQTQIPVAEENVGQLQESENEILWNPRDGEIPSHGGRL